MATDFESRNPVTTHFLNRKPIGYSKQKLSVETDVRFPDTA